MKLTKETARAMVVEYVRCGPFVVAFHRGNKGNHFIAHMLEPMERKDAIYRGMLVKGYMKSIEVPEGASLTPDYTPGMTSDDRPPITHAGRYVLEVTENDTLFLCVQRKNTKSWWKKFSYEWLNMFEGTGLAKQGTVVAIGSGAISVNGTVFPAPYVVWAQSKDITFTVVKPTLGIKVWV